MRIVIDSNILFSALVKDALTRKLILEYKESFLFPSFIFEELEKHKDELRRKSKMTNNEFSLLLKVLLEKMEFIPEEKLDPYIDDAFKIIKKIDENDVLFFASVLAFPESVLWSDDKRLKKQSQVIIMNTTEFMLFITSKK